MPRILVTRKIPDEGIDKLKEEGFAVHIAGVDRGLTKEELIHEIKNGNYDAILSVLTDKIDEDVIGALGNNCKIIANYAVGFDNIDLKAAKVKGVFVTNTPGVLTDAVAEHAVALMLSICRRIPEADRFTRRGDYHGWEPELLLGRELSRKTIGIVGLGRIGSRVAHIVKRGFNAKVIYFDVKQNPEFEMEFGAIFFADIEQLLREADYVSIHVPLLATTKHLMNSKRFQQMKKSGYLINTSRGPVVDEEALVHALKNNVIRGAAIDVFEDEPKLAPGLSECENVVLTPHIASGTEETRAKMAEMAARNIITALRGESPPQLVALP